MPRLACVCDGTVGHSLQHVGRLLVSEPQGRHRHDAEFQTWIVTWRFLLDVPAGNVSRRPALDRWFHREANHDDGMYRTIRPRLAMSQCIAARDGDGGARRGSPGRRGKVRIGFFFREAPHVIACLAHVSHHRRDDAGAQCTGLCGRHTQRGPRHTLRG